MRVGVCLAPLLLLLSVADAVLLLLGVGSHRFLVFVSLFFFVRSLSPSFALSALPCTPF